MFQLGRAGVAPVPIVILSAAKDLPLATHSVLTVRVWSVGEVLRLRLRTTWLLGDI
jgi:hypothetical protein